MRKLTIAAVVLLVLGALVAFALLNLDRLVNRNKATVLAQAEQALGRKVAVEDIGVTLWGGIGVRLKGFALADDRTFSTQDFLRADHLQVNVELLPLLRKEVRVKRLILRRPEIRIIRDKTGTFNFASLGGPRTGDREAKRDGPVPPPAPEALPFLITLVDIADGAVHYVDKKEGVDLRVSRIDLEVEELGLDRPVSIGLAAAVLAERQNVKVKGRVGPVGRTFDPAGVPIDAKFEVDGLDMGELERRFPQMKQWLPRGLDLSGPLRAQAKIAGKGDDLTLTDVRLSAAVFGANKPNFELSGRMEHVSPSLKGLSLNGDVTLGPVALAKLKRLALVAPMLPKDLNADGPVSLKAHAEGTLEKLGLTASAEASESTVQYGEFFRKPSGTPLRLSVDAIVSDARLDIKKANFTLHTLDLTSKGTVTRGQTPTLRLEVDAGRTDLAGWEKMIPMLQAYNLAGTFELRARADGPVAAGRLPDLNGSLKLSDLRAGLPQAPQPVTAKTATLTFTGQRASLPDTPVRVGQSEIRLASQVENFAPLALTYRMSAPELRPADLLHERPATKKPELLRDVKSDGRVWMEKEMLAARTRLSSPRGSISDVDYTDLQASLALADQVWTIDPLELKAYGGAMQGRGQYDARKTPPRFTLTSQVRGMQVGQLLGSWSDVSTKVIRGALNADLTLSGSGTAWDEIQRGLSGQGSAEIIQGALLDTNIAEGTLTGLTGIPGLSMFISPRIRSKYPAIFATRNTEFSELKGAMNIKDGKMQLDNLLLAAADWTARGKGWAGLDRTVDMRATLLLSPALSADLISDVKPLRYLTNKEGRVEIPLTLAGALPGVSPKPDASLVARSLERQFIGQGVEELTKGLFKGKEKAPPPTTTTPAQPAEPAPPAEKKPQDDPLKQLKELFRK